MLSADPQAQEGESPVRDGDPAKVKTGIRRWAKLIAIFLFAILSLAASLGQWLPIQADVMALIIGLATVGTIYFAIVDDADVGLVKTIFAAVACAVVVVFTLGFMPRWIGPPGPPADLRNTSDSPSHVVLSWKASGNDDRVDSYEVYRTEKSRPAQVQRIYDGRGTTIEDHTVRAGSTYIYQVVARGRDDSTSAPNPTLEIDVRVSDPDLKPPKWLPLSGLTSTSVTLSWSPPDGATAVQYNVIRDGVELAKTGQTSFMDSGLTPDREFVYVVRSIGKDAHESARSAEMRVKTPPSPPSPQVSPSPSPSQSLPPPPPPPPPIVVLDDTLKPPRSVWEGLSGGGSCTPVAEGLSVQAANQFQACLNPTTAGDLTIEADLAMGSASSTGILFRRDAEKNRWYYAGLVRTPSGKHLAVLFIHDNDTDKYLAGIDIDDDPGAGFHRISVSAHGITLTFQYDHSKSVTITDGLLASGTIGFYAAQEAGGGAKSVFRNVSVTMP